MKDITENLKKRMKELGYTQERLAAELGVTQAHINNLLNGRKAFGKKTAHEWHNRFGFNEAWLLTGTGDMLANAQTGNNNVGNNSSVSGSYNTSADAIETILRHTYATLLAEIDTPVEVISMALGHSIGSRVTQIYIRQDLRKVDEANRRLFDYVNGVTC